jgi:hypothetical protein
MTSHQARYKNPNYMKEYRQENRGLLLKKGAEYREKNRDRIRAYAVTPHYRKLQSELHKRNLDLWKQFIPAITNCQVCGMEIVFGSGDHGKSIHFDHRHGGIELIKHPMNWLKGRKPTKEYLKLWTSCDFGMLCRGCNTYLPTKDRRKFMLSLIEYTRGAV